jgi:hypothetical protein
LNVLNYILFYFILYGNPTEDIPTDAPPPLGKQNCFDSLLRCKSNA